MLLALMTGEKRQQGRSIVPVRDLNSLIGPSRGDKLAIGRPGQGVNFVLAVTSIVEDLVSRVKMLTMLDGGPIAQRTIPGTGGHTGVVRLPADAEYAGGMPAKIEAHSRVCCVPNLDAFILTARCNGQAIFRPGDAIDPVGMPFEGEAFVPVRGIPDLDGFIL